MIDRETVTLWERMKNPRRPRLLPRRLRNPILWTGLILISFCGLLLWGKVENIFENVQTAKKPADPVIDFAATEAADDRQPDPEDREAPRRVYPYSVVKGGVHTVQELRSAIGRDPVVARHYANFKLDRARVIEARADGDFHVSYRMGEEIFWTKKKLRVATNEKLITDGTTFTRTRCANVLSEVLPGKTSPDEPAPEVFDSPTPPPSHSTRSNPPAVVGGGPPAAADTPPMDPSGGIGGGPPAEAMSPSGFIPPVRITGGSLVPGGENSFDPGSIPVPGSDNNPIPVPEPAAVLLFVSGLLGLAGYGGKKFFKK